VRRDHHAEVDEHEGSHNRSRPLGGDAQVRAGSVDAQEGIPVEFAIPQKALALGDERAQGAVRWIVDVKAPLPETDFYAIFPLVVRPRKA